MLRFETLTDAVAHIRAHITACVEPRPASSPLPLGGEGQGEGVFNEFALSLFEFQYRNNAAYARFCAGRGVAPDHLTDWREIPALPTAAFKELEVTCLPPESRIAEFHSSGTTEQKPSRHYHSAETIALYEASLAPWFEKHLLSGLDELENPTAAPGMIFLTPPPASAPHSSLAHMLGVVGERFGARDSVFGGRVEPDGTWGLDLDRLLFAVRKSMCANRPIIILGTAFNFVNLLDHFATQNIRYRLAAGSRVMETGGYKGRSRELPKTELHGLIQKHLGIAPDHIVCEYGMCELGSQAYDCQAGQGKGLRIFRFPPWVRVRMVSPETGREAPPGQPGFICVYDLANAGSVLAVQTGDLGIERDGGFELLGRAPAVEPRGCSLMSGETHA